MTDGKIVGGAILIIIGLIIFWNISILFGLILVIIGISMIVRSNQEKQKQQNKQQYRPSSYGKESPYEPYGSSYEPQFNQSSHRPEESFELQEESYKPYGASYESQSNQTSHRPTNSEKNCPNCGAKFESEHVAFCTNCGASLS